MATIENYRSRIVAAPVSLNVDPDHKDEKIDRHLEV